MKTLILLVTLGAILPLAAFGNSSTRTISLTVTADRDHAWTDNATLVQHGGPGSQDGFIPGQGPSPLMFVIVVNSDGNGKSYACSRGFRCELDSIEVTRDYFGVLVMNKREGSVFNLMALFEKRFHLVNAGIFRASATAINPASVQRIQSQLSNMAQRYGLNMPDIIRAGAPVQSMAPLQEMLDIQTKYGILRMEECLPSRPCFPKGGPGGFSFSGVTLSRCEDVAAPVEARLAAADGLTLAFQAATGPSQCDAIDYVWSFGDGSVEWTKERSISHRFPAPADYRVLVGARCSRKRESTCILDVVHVSASVR